jgi:hypothetical protein
MDMRISNCHVGPIQSNAPVSLIPMGIRVFICRLLTGADLRKLSGNLTGFSAAFLAQRQQLRAPKWPICPSTARLNKSSSSLRLRISSLLS